MDSILHRRFTTLNPSWYPAPPLANSRVSARRSPGWGGGDGRQVTVSRGGGGLQGYFKANCGTPPPLSFPTPGKTVPHHPLGDGHQVTVPHPPLGDHTPTVHAHLQAQKLQHKTKEFTIGCVQRAANVQRPTP